MNTTGRRRRRVAAVAGLAAASLSVLSAGPAHAIETRQFGIEPSPRVAGGANRSSITAKAAAGSTHRDAIRVWNKGSRPVTLLISTAPATKEPDGSVRLGGPSAPLGWVGLESTKVTLAGKAAAVVPVSIRIPRSAREDTALALVVQPIAAAGAEPAVLERLAMMVYIQPDGVAAPAEGQSAVLVGLAAALAAGVAGWLVIAGRRTRRPAAGGGRVAPAV